jgi:hypothetical protein
MVENLTKMAEQLPGYQVLLVLLKAVPPPNTAVSHNGELNSLSGIRFTLLMRWIQHTYLGLIIQMILHETW